MNLHNQYWIILNTTSLTLVDVGSKYLASKTLNYGNPLEITSCLNLTLIYNYGAAFSLLNNPNTIWQTIFLSIIAIIIAIIILRYLIANILQQKITSMTYALSLILSGILGNLFDRITHGYVIDFLDFHIYNYHWPIFNISDLMICIGGGILLYLSICDNKNSG